MGNVYCADTGGSCRIPASLNGVAGLRPTKGCYIAGDGVVPLSTTRDTPGAPDSIASVGPYCVSALTTIHLQCLSAFRFANVSLG
jgi:hypothetical protein